MKIMIFLFVGIIVGIAGTFAWLAWYLKDVFR